MKLPSYLRITRHNVYVFRRRIPLEIRHHFKTDEIRLSLRTSMVSEAVRNARIWAIDTDHLFFILNNNMALDDYNNRLLQIINQKKRELRLLEQNEQLESVIADKKAEILQIKQQHEREIELIDRFKPSVIPEHITTVKSSLKLSKMIEMFFSASELARRGDKEATIRKDRDALKLFIEITGDKPIQDVLQSDAARYSTKLSSYKRKSEQGPRAANTVNNHMGSVSKFSSWVTSHHSEQGHHKLDFSGLRYSSARHASEEREMFEGDEIKRIFTHHKFRALKLSDPSRYWLLLIALYSGMRLEEITQLHPLKDIRLDDQGIWIFDINEQDGKSLKNKSSARQVPVHQALINLGLLDYVDSVKTRATRLFPDTLERDGRTGKNLGKKANYFINRIVGVEGKTLHSFRHTFSTILKRAMVEETLAASILGHAHGGITYGRYGKRHLVEVLKETLEDHINFEI